MKSMRVFFLSELLEQKGLHVRVFTLKINSYNFAASLYPLEMGKPNVVFLKHIDVVHSREDSLWTYPPFAGIIADGFVWGRGAIECKSLGIMQLMAVSHFGKYIFLSGSPRMTHTNGIPTGRLSGIAHNHIPFYLQKKSCHLIK